MDMEHNALGMAAITRYGVSDELCLLLEGLRDTPGNSHDGSSTYKYRPKDIDNLSRTIICRNYSKACLELSYLLLAVQQAYQDKSGAPVLNFFWVDEAITPGRFRHAMAQPYHSDTLAIAMGSDYLQMMLGDSGFDISPTRVGFLAALLELLVNIRGDCLDLCTVLQHTPTVSAVEQLASDMQSWLYAYLADHIKPAQQQRRFRAIWQWLEQQGDAGNIDDQRVFLFWQQFAVAAEDKLGFKRFRTVVDNFFAIREALDIGQQMQAIQHAAVIGHDQDNYEISPDQLFEVLENSHREGESIEVLGSKPKFLTNKQIEPIGPIMRVGKAAGALPLTLARAEVFGDHQAAIIQAVRSKKADRLKQLLNTEIPIDYRQYLAVLEQLIPKLEQAALSGLQVLLEVEDTEALSQLTRLLSPPTLSELGALLENVDLNALFDRLELDDSDEDSQVLSDQFFKQFPALCLQLPELNQLVQTARQALKANNREGFKSLPTVDAVGPYVAGIECLQRAQRQLQDYLVLMQSTLAGQGPHSINFNADLSIVMDNFQMMYGEAL